MVPERYSKVLKQKRALVVDVFLALLWHVIRRVIEDCWHNNQAPVHFEIMTQSVHAFCNISLVNKYTMLRET